MPAGRPTKYKPEYVEQVYKFCLLGATNEELAGFFDTTIQTLNAWMNEYPEFLDAIKEGRERADSNVTKKLYHRAIGYEHPEDKIFIHNGEPVIVPTVKHYPPDPVAAIFWLKNRQRGKWRDKQEHEISGNLVLIKGEDNLED